MQLIHTGTVDACRVCARERERERERDRERQRETEMGGRRASAKEPSSLDLAAELSRRLLYQACSTRVRVLTVGYKKLEPDAG